MGSAGQTLTLNARVLRFRSSPELEDAVGLAEDLLVAERYSDARAIAISAQVEGNGPGAPLALLEGRAWYLDGDRPRAQTAFLKAVKLDPGLAEGFRWLGTVLYARDDLERAVRAFERALELDPDDAEARRLLHKARIASPVGSLDADPDDTLRARSPLRRSESRSDGVGAARVPSSEPPPPPPSPNQLRTPVAPPPLEVPNDPGMRLGHARTPLLRPPSVRPGPLADRPAMPSAGAAAPMPGASRSAARNQPASRDLSARKRRESASEQDMRGPDARRDPRQDPPSRDFSARTRRDPRAAEPLDDPSAGTRDDPSATRRDLPAVDDPQALRSAEPARDPRARAQQQPPSRDLSPATRHDPPAADAHQNPDRADALRDTRAGARRDPPSQDLSSTTHRDLPGADPRRVPLGSDAPLGVRASARQESPSRDLVPRTPRDAGAADPRQDPRAAADPHAPRSAAQRSDSRPDVDRDPRGADVPRAGRPDMPGTARSQREFRGSDASPRERASSGPAEHTLPGAGPLSRDLRNQVPLPGAAGAGGSSGPAPPGANLPQRGGVSASSGELGQAGHSPPRSPAPPATHRVAAAPAPGLDEVDAVLALLGRHGIFESPESAGASWTSSQQVERSGTPLRGTLIGIWIVALALSVGGYFGWQYWVQRRHEQAGALVVKARAAAFLGDYRALVDAERMLAEARELYPRSSDVLRLQLLVSAQRVLESGSRELSALRIATLRAKQLAVDPSYLDVTRAVMAAYSGERADTRAALEQAQKSARGEPELLYILGRLEQRMGEREAALARLTAAGAAAPDMLAVAVAQAELQQQEGRDADALAGFQALLKRRPGHVRAQLWIAFLSAPTRELAPALAELAALSKLAHAGTASERILWALARSRLLGRSGRRVEAVDALREALAAGAGEPQLLATVAEQARGMSQLGLAQQAATLAVGAAPAAGSYRSLLATILIERHDGEHALALLADVPAAQPGIVALRARAALQATDPQAQRAALGPVEAQLAAHRADPEVQALRLRLLALLEPDAKLLTEAKAAARRAPSNPYALRALGEVALALRSPGDATSALKQLATLTPGDPELLYLLGRARRMAADAPGAALYLRRAILLSPGYPEAVSVLGALLLDTGDYAGAQAVYQELVVQSPVAARLGMVEAAIGAGRLDDAQTQLGAVPEAQRDSLPVRETSARLWLARGKPKQAIEALAAVAEDENRPSTLALYGDALLAADQLKPAGSAYERALKLDAGLPEALLGQAELQLRSGAGKDALELLRRAKAELTARLRPPELRARALALLGLTSLEYAKKKDVQSARDLLQQALELDPNGRYATRIKHALEL